MAEQDGFDKEADPLVLTEGVQNDTERAVRELLWSLQRLSGLKANLEEQRKQLNQSLIPMLKQLGRPVMVMNPATGDVEIAAPREDETLEVDAGALLQALIAHFKAEGDHPEDAYEEASTIWQDVLKPPVVDTKEDGLFRSAVVAGRIPGHVAAKVATFKKKAPWVGFTKPKPRD